MENVNLIRKKRHPKVERGEWAECFPRPPTFQEQAPWNHLVAATPPPWKVYLNPCSLKCLKALRTSTVIHRRYLLSLNSCHITKSDKIVLYFTSKSSGKISSLKCKTKSMEECSVAVTTHTHTHTHCPLLLRYIHMTRSYDSIRKIVIFADACVSVEKFAICSQNLIQKVNTYRYMTANNVDMKTALPETEQIPVKTKESESERKWSLSVVSDSLRSHGL